jgi:hypothetical protein
MTSSKDVHLKSSVLRYCPQVLLRYCSGTAQVLLGYCSSTAQVLWVLLRYCSGIPQVFLRYSWVLLRYYPSLVHRYCSGIAHYLPSTSFIVVGGLPVTNHTVDG